MGDVDYNGDEMLVRGADDGYDGGPMELDIGDMSGGDTALGDAGAVADAVERLVKEGFAVREKGGGTRRCGYGDICVLLRSRARFGLYAAEFARRGIPSFADTGREPSYVHGGLSRAFSAAGHRQPRTGRTFWPRRWYR